MKTTYCSTVICMYFRMYVHYDKLHTLERILLPSADGTRVGDILHSQVGHFWVLPDTEAVHVLERWPHAESHRGKHCKSELYQSKKRPPHCNSSDTCTPGSLYRVWDTFGRGTHHCSPRRPVLRDCSRRLGQRLRRIGLRHRSRLSHICSRRSKRSVPGRNLWDHYGIGHLKKVTRSK